MVTSGYPYLHTDKGTEFSNRNVATMLKRKGIVHYSTENGTIKAVIVEMFNRTVPEGMSRLMEHRDSNLYLMILQMATATHIIADMVGTRKTLRSTLKVGDHVRMVGPRRVFACGYHERWTRMFLCFW